MFDLFQSDLMYVYYWHNISMKLLLSGSGGKMGIWLFWVNFGGVFHQYFYGQCFPASPGDQTGDLKQACHRYAGIFVWNGESWKKPLMFHFKGLTPNPDLFWCYFRSLTLLLLHWKISQCDDLSMMSSMFASSSAGTKIYCTYIHDTPTIYDKAIAHGRLWYDLLTFKISFDLQWPQQLKNKARSPPPCPTHKQTERGLKGVAVNKENKWKWKIHNNNNK